MVLPDRGGSHANQRFSLLLKPPERRCYAERSTPVFLYELLGLYVCLGEGYLLGGREKAVSFLRL